MTAVIRRRLDPADERGAVLPIFALLLVVLLAAAAFAVDLGMQRVLARDLQGTADVVALDLARRLDAGTRADVENLWHSGPLDASLDRNTDNVGAIEQVDVEAGRLAADGSFTSIATSEVPDAVRVTIAGRVPFAFTAGFGGPASGPATRSAVATANGLRPGAPGSACIRLGSFALGLDSSSSPLLDPILGGALNTTLVGYAGLADATITLGDLAAELVAGTPQELAATDVTLGDLYAATADVLRNGGDTAHAALLDGIVTTSVSSVSIALGDLLAVGQAGTAALAAHVNVLDLVTGAAFVANGTNAIAVPGLGVTVPGVAGLSASLRVTQGPVLACDDSVAETSQVQLTLGGTLTGLPLVVANPSFAMTLDLATARAGIIDIDCTANPPGSLDVNVHDRSVARQSLATSMQVSVTVVPLLDIRLLDLSVVAGTAPSTAPPTVVTVDTTTFSDGMTAPRSSGPGSIGLTPLSVSTNVTIAGLPVSALLAPLLSPLVGALNSTIGALDHAIVTQIAPQLGMTVAGADVWALDAPTCAQPVLRS